MTSILNGNDNSGESSPCSLQINKAKQWVLAVIAVLVVAVVGAVAATVGSSSGANNNGVPTRSKADIRAIVTFLNTQTLSGQTLAYPVNETSSTPETLALSLIVSGGGVAKAYKTDTVWDRLRLVQVYALLTLYALNDDNASDNYNFAELWLDGVSDECTWFGVTCTSKDLGMTIGTVDVVTEIDLSFHNLHGSLSSDLGLLAHLESFTVEGNAITGTLPTTIGLWTELREFKVTLNNGLTGRIPVSIANWTLLESIVIWNTTLTGTIPDSLCDTAIEASKGCNVNCSCCANICFEDLL
jgi:hypothetical protein